MGIIGVVLCLMNIIIPFVHLVGLGLGIAATVIGSRGLKAKLRYSVGSLVLGIIAISLGVLMMILGMVLATILW